MTREFYLQLKEKTQNEIAALKATKGNLIKTNLLIQIAENKLVLIEKELSL